jgi:two-component system nitrate/nitrite response regulator NarL
MDKVQEIRILIADDDPIVRLGLRKLLEPGREFVVVGEASDGEQTVQQARALHPDVLLLDLAMPQLSGLEALAEVAATPNAVRTIILAARIGGPELIKSLQLGARGVMLKISANELLVECVRRVMAGEYWLGRECVAILAQALSASTNTHPPTVARKSFGLTPRELEITANVVEGYSNKEVAQKLGISEDTIKHHLSNIFDKVGASNRLELALFAMRHGLIED